MTDTTSPGSTASPADQSVLALQSCLGAEHAAVYGYGVLGGVLAEIDSADEPEELAVTCFQQHRKQRDALIALVRDLGSDPVAGEAAYALPFAVEDVASCRRLARRIEHRCARTYAAAVTQTTKQVRERLALVLGDCAVRAVQWEAEPTAFPGLRRR